MIINKLYARNFKSIGKAGLKINLKENTFNLIRGVSGSGKSTLLDVICFNLYGVSSIYKGSSKSQEPTTKLINDVNKKDLLTEIEINGFTIRRGLKPSVFEIIKDGINLADKSAKAIDQDYIIQNVLNGITYEIFMAQNYLCNKISSISFFYMTSTQRKDYIESILDIRKIYHLNEHLKKEIQVNDIDFKTKEKEIELQNNSINNEQINISTQQQKKAIRDQEIKEHEQQKIIYINNIKEQIQSIKDNSNEEFKLIIENSLNKTKTIQDNSINQRKDINEFIISLKETNGNLLFKENMIQGDINTNYSNLKKPDNKLEQYRSELQETNTKIQRIKDALVQKKAEKDAFVKTKENYTVCGDCPKLEKLIGSYDIDNFNTIQDKSVKVFRELHTKTKELEEQIRKALEVQEFNLNITNTVQNLKQELKQLQDTVQSNERLINSEEQKLENFDNNIKVQIDSVLKQQVLDQEQKKKEIENSINVKETLIKNKLQEHKPSEIEVSLEYLNTLEKTLKEQTEERDKLYNEKNELKILKEVINDKQLKEQMLKSYIPLFEDHLNNLLDRFFVEQEFSLKCKLKDDFELVFHKNGREVSPYMLSSGQKELVSNALTFSFLYLINIKHKNGLKILLIDELLDSSISNNLIYILEYLKEMSKEYNINIISHNQNLPLEMFDDIYNVQKQGVFTKYTKE